MADESSLLFHTINRNKESFTADLGDAEDMQWIKLLISKADVITHNFRPGVMAKKGISLHRHNHFSHKHVVSFWKQAENEAVS